MFGHFFVFFLSFYKLFYFLVCLSCVGMLLLRWKPFLIFWMPGALFPVLLTPLTFWLVPGKLKFVGWCLFFSQWEQHMDQLSLVKKNQGVLMRLKVSGFDSTPLFDLGLVLMNIQFKHLSKEKCWIWSSALIQTTVCSWVTVWPPWQWHQKATFPLSAMSFQMIEEKKQSKLIFLKAKKLCFELCICCQITESSLPCACCCIKGWGCHLKGWGRKQRQGCMKKLQANVTVNHGPVSLHSDATRVSCKEKGMLFTSCHKGFWAALFSEAIHCLFTLLFWLFWFSKTLAGNRKFYGWNLTMLKLSSWLNATLHFSGLGRMLPCFCSIIILLLFLAPFPQHRVLPHSC